MSNWAQPISVVFPLVDQYTIPHFELVVFQFVVTTIIMACLLVVQRTVDKRQILAHLRNPVLELDGLVTF